MANNALIRKRVNDIQAQVKTERDWWDKRKAKIQSDFMKELNEPNTVAPTGGKSNDEDGVLVESGGPDAQLSGQQAGMKKRKGKK